MMFEGLSTIELIFVGLPFTFLGFIIGVLFVGILLRFAEDKKEKKQ